MSHPGQRLSALIDGELGAAERDRVLAHLVRCEPCRQEAVALRALKQRMTALGGADAESDLVARLLAMTPPAGRSGPDALRPGPGAALRAVGSGAGRRRRSGPRRVAAVAALASSLAVAGFTVAAFLAGGGSPHPTPTITPAVDVFMMQHALTPGTGPAAPVPQARLTHTGAP